MSGTRSGSPRAPATENAAVVLVAHGSPSAPEPAERWIRALAEKVEDRVRGVEVRGATLAAEGAFERAIADTAPFGPMIYPMFMADGWFVREAIPARLAEMRAGRFRVVRPFGRDPGVWALCRDAALKAAARNDWKPADIALVIAAHGSPSDPRPRDAAEQAARFIRRKGLFRSVTCGFVDESPILTDAARVADPAICLPFFANSARHVEIDVPEMLSAAGFEGVILDPIGHHERSVEPIARFIGQTLRQPTL